MLLEKIKKLCADRGITIHRIEVDCKIGNGTISAWDKSRPQSDTLLKVAEYFGVSMEYLLKE